MEGVAGISRPRRRRFPGGGLEARSHWLPSGGIRPPPSEGLRAVRSPSFTARFFHLGSMIRKKPAPHLMRGGYRFSLAANAERVCAEIMLEQKIARVPGRLASACGPRHGERKPIN